MFRLKKSLLATALAWFSAVFIIMASSQATQSESYRAANPVEDFFRGLAFIGGYVGIVVISTCLLIVTPLLCALPSHSRMWRPLWACVIGMVSGPIAMYLWALGFRGKFFIPEPHDSTHLMLGICSAVTGVVFAYSYSRGIAQVTDANAIHQTKNEAEQASASDGK